MRSSDIFLALKGILEFATPCNGGGFAPKSQCHESTYWGICLGDEDDNHNYPGGCRYMNEYDDCSWDDPKVTMPDKVNIYRSQPGSFVVGRVAVGEVRRRRP